MPKASLLLRPEPTFRFDAFASGLASLGFEITNEAKRDPKPGDVLVLWNRYAQREPVARTYERAGATVLIAENGYLGREWRGGVWYALSVGHHNGAGRWPEGSPERWDGWNVELKPWRDGGDEVVILAQRGFGHEDVREPRGWPRRAMLALQAAGIKARIRRHPGERGKLERRDDGLSADLANASACVTWASGAAFKALVMGIPVFNGFRQWIGKDAARLFKCPLAEPFLGDRLPMFRRLAWAMWDTEELASGEAFRCVLR